MSIEAYAVLRITSQTLTPAQIDARVGLKANRAQRKGDQRGTSRGRPVLEKENRWAVLSSLARTEPIEAHVADLSRKIRSYVARIRELAEENVITFTCVMYVRSAEEYNPEVFLPRDTVDLISALGADFWVDMYFLASADEAEDEA